MDSPEWRAATHNRAPKKAASLGSQEPYVKATENKKPIDINGLLNDLKAS
jgi:hypothetical protein